MDTVDDLITWYRGVLDRIEQMAHAAADGYPHWDTNPDGTVNQVGTGGNGYLAVGPWNGGLFAAGEHMALHDPAAVLARVAADRRILEQCTITLQRLRPPLPPGGGAGERALAELTVEMLALPYAHWPGYREGWRP